MRRRRPVMPKSGPEALAMFKAMTDTGPPPTVVDPLADEAPGPDVRSRITDILDIVGLAVVVFGVGLVYMPAGVILGGLSCVLLGWKIDRER